MLQNIKGLPFLEPGKKSLNACSNVVAWLENFTGSFINLLSSTEMQQKYV